MTENLTTKPELSVVNQNPICVICNSPMPIVDNGTYSFDKDNHSLRIAMFKTKSGSKQIKESVCFPCVQAIIANAKLEVKQ